MLQYYIEYLTEAIRAHQKIRKHTQLKGAKWTKSCFELAADIISTELGQMLSASEHQQMGATISAKTLSNMFRGEYRISYPIDPRTLNTLTKLARFAGHSAWESFAEAADAAQQQASNEQTPEAAAAFMLRQSLDLEFKLLCALPEIHPEKLKDCFIAGSPAFNRIVDNLLHFQEAGLNISNPYNPSSFDILELRTTEVGEVEVRLRTREFWLLCWWSDALARYVRRQKEIQDHYYTIVKTSEGWRVKANTTLSDVMEAAEIQDLEIELTPGA